MELVGFCEQQGLTKAKRKDRWKGKKKKGGGYKEKVVSAKFQVQGLEFQPIVRVLVSLTITIQFLFTDIT